MLLSVLFKIKDSRRREGRRYELSYVLLFSILAILCNADSYRSIHTFIKSKFDFLKKLFNLKWERPPSYTSIRYIILSVQPEDIENAFREYSNELIQDKIKEGSVIAFDGKTLKDSFDNLQDKKAIHILSAFLVEEQIILAHEEVDEKTNEIPVAQELIQELGLKNCIFTFDALNAQKKL
jgi:hypothetical protein